MGAIVITASLLAQVAAAVLALRLAWRSRSWAWLCLAVAMILLTIARVHSMVNLLAGRRVFLPAVEVTVLIASTSALVGLAFIAIERSQAHAELRFTEDFNRQIVDSLPGGLVYISLEGAILRANAEAERMLGLSYDQLKRRYLRDWEGQTIHEDGTPYPVAEYPANRCMETGESQPPVTIGVRRPDGEITWAVFSAIPYLEQSTRRCIGTVVTFLDVTARKKAEEALQRSQDHYRQVADSNTRLLQEVNHRVRNNLGNLLGLISLSRRKTADSQEFAATLEARVMVMAQVHNLLAQSGWRDLNLRSLVMDLAASLQRTAPYPTPVDIDGPPTRISPRQGLPLAMTFLELFTNSFKHGAHASPTGRVSVSWELVRESAASVGRVHLTWREAGGKPITGTVQPSLGTELIEGFMSFELGGACHFAYPPGGACHRIEFAIDEGDGMAATDVPEALQATPGAAE